MAELKGLERIKRQIIQLQKNQPFFSCLLMYLKFKPIGKETEKIIGNFSMGVDMSGNVIYNEEWVNGLDDVNLQAVLVHELSHVIFAHILRKGNRNKEIFNIASDICINSLLMDNKFKLPEGTLIVSNNYTIEIPTLKGNILIEKINEKTAEQIYGELEKKLPKINISEFLSESGIDKIRFDEHIEGVVGKELSEEEKENIRQEWQRRVEEVALTNRLAGTLPAGIERLIGKLRESRVDWKVLLRKFIKKQMSGQENNWKKPNKKFRVFGYHFPTTKTYGVDVCAVIDLSGSISEKNLSDFVSEIIGISNQYRNRINLRIITHETEVNDDYEVKRANKQKILKKLKLKGGGGTSFEGVINLLNKDYKDIKNKSVIWLSDGYGTSVKKQKFPILWVLCEGGTDEYIKGSGKVVRLED